MGSTIDPTVVQNLPGFGLAQAGLPSNLIQDVGEFNRYDKDDNSDIEEQYDDNIRNENGSSTIVDYLYDCMRHEIEGNHI